MGQTIRTAGRQPAPVAVTPEPPTHRVSVPVWLISMTSRGFGPSATIRAATALGILALANLTCVQPRAGVAQQPQLRAPIAASVAYSRDSLAVLSRDSLKR